MTPESYAKNSKLNRLLEYSRKRLDKHSATNLQLQAFKKLFQIEQVDIFVIAVKNIIIYNR